MTFYAKFARILVACIGCNGAFAMAADSAMRNVFPQDLQWRQAEGFSSGVEIAIVHGDPESAGVLVYRLRLSAGAKLDPHQDTDERWYTVLAGTFAIGIGDTARWNDAKEQPVRSFFVVPANTLHYGYAKTDAILQVQTRGPVKIRQK